MYSIIDSMLSMKMDVYKQFDSQNSETGAIVKEWTYHKTVPCHAKGIISNSATTRSGDRQSFSNKYDNEQVIQIKTIEKITLREKVTNITDKNNNVIWEELNFPTSTPTVFEVVGTTPVTDPLGSVIAYNSVLKRSENQQIGQ